MIHDTFFALGETSGVIVLFLEPRDQNRGCELRLSGVKDLVESSLRWFQSRVISESWPCLACLQGCN